MHPIDIFKYLAEYFQITDIDFNKTKEGTKSYSFIIGETNRIPKDLISTLSTLSKLSREKENIYSKYTINLTTVSYVVSKKGNESLVLSQTNKNISHLIMGSLDLENNIYGTNLFSIFMIMLKYGIILQRNLKKEPMNLYLLDFLVV